MSTRNIIHQSSQTLGTHQSTTSALSLSLETCLGMSLGNKIKHKQQSPLQYCPQPQMIEKYKRSPTKFRQIKLEVSTTECRHPHTYYTSNQISVKLPNTENPDPLSECGTSRQVTMLKPCLRKADSNPKSLHRRVTFNSSINDAKQQRRHSVCPPEFVE